MKFTLTWYVAWSTKLVGHGTLGKAVNHKLVQLVVKLAGVRSVSFSVTVYTEWWGAGVVVCLERGADLHMAQLSPLPLTVSCFSKIQIGFTFLVAADLGSPGQMAVKRVCVWLRKQCQRYWRTDHFLQAVQQWIGLCCVCVQAANAEQRYQAWNIKTLTLHWVLSVWSCSLVNGVIFSDICYLWTGYLPPSGFMSTIHLHFELCVWPAAVLFSLQWIYEVLQKLGH